MGSRTLAYALITTITATLNVLHYAIDGDGSRRGSRDNDMRVLPGGDDIAFRHRKNSSAKLLCYRLGAATALADITLHAAPETQVVGGFNVHGGIEKFAKLWPVQSEEPFEDHEFGRIEHLTVTLPDMLRKVVTRSGDALAVSKPLSMTDQELILERVGIVEVRRCALG